MNGVGEGVTIVSQGSLPRNVISGNSGDGVDITGSGTTGNVVEGNIIGRNAAGTSVLLNGGYAVAIEAGAQAAVSGFVTGNVLNDGVLSLQGLGFLNITGNYTQTANGSLDLSLGGTGPGTFDQLFVSGTVTLAGDLTAHLIDGFTPTVGESDTVITFLSSTGAFASQHFDNPGNGDLLTSSLTPTSLVVKAVSDLVLAGQSSANATVGGMITYTLTVTNDGPTGLSNVNLSDLLPTGTTLASWVLQSSTATDPWTLHAPAVGSVGTATASIGFLDAGDVAVFLLTVLVDAVTAPGTIITNTATVAPLAGDPNTTNNRVTLQTGIYSFTIGAQSLVLNAAPNSHVVIDATQPTAAAVTINGEQVVTADVSNFVTVETSGGDTVQVIGNVTANLNGSGSDTLIGGAGTNNFTGGSGNTFVGGSGVNNYPTTSAPVSALPITIVIPADVPVVTNPDGTKTATVDLSKVNAPVDIVYTANPDQTVTTVITGGSVSNTFIKAADQTGSVEFIGGGAGSTNVFQVAPSGTVG